MKYKGILKHSIKEAVSLGVVTGWEAERLIPTHPVVPIFNHLPKVHKSTVSIQGRPIVATIDCLGEPLGDLIDTSLQLLSDMKQTIWKLDGVYME